MTSERQSFWDHASFAVVGDSARRAFPKLTYRGLKKEGKTVYPVDPAGSTVEGDATYPDLTSLPAPVEAVVLEVPKDQTAAWVGKAADSGVKAVWMHQQTDTPEAIKLAEENHMELCHGTCAVMYVTPGFSFHSFHRFVQKLSGKY